jgi:hydroxymethylbilane synthase
VTSRQGSGQAALRLGTRGSQLALWQAHAVKAAIERETRRTVHIVVIRTSGDALAEAPLAEVGGKRLFVREIEEALLRDDIDLAVHSAKDLPAVLPDGLIVGAVLPREDPMDVVVLAEHMARSVPPPPEASADHPSAGESGVRRDPTDLSDLVDRLGQEARVGTSSVRRIAQLSRVIPHTRFRPIRGNLDTRLRKLDRGDYDMLVLAAAGLRRLGFGHRISLRVPLEVCVPAPGQGAVAVEIRAGDTALQHDLASIDDERTGRAIAAERALVAALGGGCQVPIGALAVPIDDQLDLHAVVISLDGERAIRAQDRAPGTTPAALGELVAEKLIADGAMEILAAVRREQGAVEGLQP